MPEKNAPQLKNSKLYDKLREDGNSKQKSARISNAVASQGAKKVSTKGGASRSYDEWTVPELKRRAKEIGLTGFSSKRKSELVEALRNS